MSTRGRDVGGSRSGSVLTSFDGLRRQRHARGGQHVQRARFGGRRARLCELGEQDAQADLQVLLAVVQVQRKAAAVDAAQLGCVLDDAAKGQRTLAVVSMIVHHA